MAEYIFDESLSGSTVIGTDENDSIYFQSDVTSVSIDLGAGSDVLNIDGIARQITITGSEVSNDIQIATITGATSVNQIDVANESGGNVSAQALNTARFFIYQTNSSGVNRVNIDSVAGGNNIFFMSVAGSASNEVSIDNVVSSNNFFAIDLGAGNASFGSNSDQIAIGDIASSNDFHMWLDGGNDSLKIGSVDENVSIAAVAINSLTAEIGNVSDGGTLTFLGGNQFNSIKIENLGNSSYLNAELQDGNDLVEIGDIGSNSNVTIQGNGGSDIFKFASVQGHLEITSSTPKHINRVDVSRNPGITPETFDSTVEFNGIDLEIASVGNGARVNVIGGSDSDKISIGAIDDANIQLSLSSGNDSIYLENVSENANISILFSNGSMSSIDGGYQIEIGSGMTKIFTDSQLILNSDGAIFFNSDLNSIDGLALSIDGSSQIATLTATESDDFNLNFNSSSAISRWNVTLESGNDILNISDVQGGNFNSGSGQDVFSVSSDLQGNITLSGGDDGDIFYADSSVDHKITLTDIDFNANDIVMIDSSVDSLSKSDFGNGKFLNFDASDLLKELGMTFSMIRVAEKSSASLDDENSIDEDQIYNVVWANSKSATIDFHESQSEDVLIFTNTNSKGDIVSLGGYFDDTIHAGLRDTIDSGGGNDLIYVDKKTHVIFSEGDDSVYNWNSSNVLEVSSNVTIQNGDSIDVIDFSSESVDEITRSYSSSELILVDESDSSLNIFGTDFSKFQIAYNPSTSI